MPSSEMPFFFFPLHEHLLHHRTAYDSENCIVKENNVIKKIALVVAEGRSEGAEGADRRFARCTSPGARAQARFCTVASVPRSHPSARFPLEGGDRKGAPHFCAALQWCVFLCILNTN